MRVFWFLLLHIFSTQANITVTWDTFLGTNNNYSISTSDHILLNWGSGHNVYSKSGSCLPLSLNPNDWTTTIYANHPNPGVVSVVSFQIVTPGLFCIACTAHLNSMQFTVQVIQQSFSIIMPTIYPPPFHPPSPILQSPPYPNLPLPSFPSPALLSPPNPPSQSPPNSPSQSPPNPPSQSPPNPLSPTHFISPKYDYLYWLIPILVFLILMCKLVLIIWLQQKN